MSSWMSSVKDAGAMAFNKVKENQQFQIVYVFPWRLIGLKGAVRSSPLGTVTQQAESMKVPRGLEPNLGLSFLSDAHNWPTKGAGDKTIDRFRYMPTFWNLLHFLIHAHAPFDRHKTAQVCRRLQSRKSSDDVEVTCLVVSAKVLMQHMKHDILSGSKETMSKHVDWVKQTPLFLRFADKFEPAIAPWPPLPILVAWLAQSTQQWG
eukprot:686899-Hanusia_phi.AAC.7